MPNQKEVLRRPASTKPPCYNRVIMVDSTGNMPLYIEDINGEKIAMTDDRDKAKLFRDHVGWMGPGRDWDCHHVAISQLIDRLTSGGTFKELPLDSSDSNNPVEPDRLSRIKLLDASGDKPVKTRSLYQVVGQP